MILHYMYAYNSLKIFGRKVWFCKLLLDCRQNHKHAEYRAMHILALPITFTEQIIFIALPTHTHKHTSIDAHA